MDTQCVIFNDSLSDAKQQQLLEAGDAVMAHDTGTYCFSNHFMYNALTLDPVYSCSQDEAGQYVLTRINAGDSVAQLIENFS
jgi:hypothetical protein